MYYIHYEYKTHVSIYNHKNTNVYLHYKITVNCRSIMQSRFDFCINIIINVIQHQSAV